MLHLENTYTLKGCRFGWLLSKPATPLKWMRHYGLKNVV